MPHVPEEELMSFDQALRSAYQRLGGGKIGFDSNSVRAAVRAHRAAAHRYVEIHHHIAASQPGYLQPAMMVAAAYQVEFNDATLVEMVMERAKELNAMEHLEAIGFAPNVADLRKEPPEREAARQWWKSSSKKDGMCDSCRTPLRRGDGYMLDGRLVMLGEMKINIGEELLCEACFRKHRAAPRDPGGKGDNYKRID